MSADTVARPADAAADAPVPAEPAPAAGPAPAPEPDLADEADDHNQDQSPVEPRELLGWKLFGFGTEGYSALGTAVFFPLILESLAASQAYDSATLSSPNPVPCNTTASSYSCSLYVGSSWVDTSSFVFYATTISVFVQFLLFINLGALADHGNHRKQFLIGFTVITAVLGICMLFVVRENLLWLATIIFMVSNVTFCASYVFFYAWVPVLTRHHPDSIKAREDKLPPEEYHAVTDRVGNDISSQGFLYGYIAAVIELILGAGIYIAMGSGNKLGLPEYYPLHIGVAMSGIWMLVFLPFTYKWLKPRPGPPLPAGQNYILFSLKKLGRTLYKASQLGQLFLFLLGWFIYSDGFTTIISVAILFFRTEVGVSASNLLIAAIVTPLFGGIGNYVWIVIQRKLKLTTKTVLMIQATMYCLLCLYGIIGFATPEGSWGLRNKAEIFPLAAYHGFLLGATQSSCRVLFSELLPPGFESEFFSLYEITDKGSAWIGPLIVGVIGDSTHNKRNSFFFLLAMLGLPIFIFWQLDVAKGKKQAREYVKQEEIVLDLKKQK
ncbi:Autophagy protein 22 [Polyrhizophydium stewartii]|uniref:Autophagy-related protein n=1 Tax=Polyrhizophydium stewartii TaxID=2732419 RepID=A0ABR4NDY5_9FUNG